jgi:2'-5' RNA ligase
MPHITLLYPFRPRDAFDQVMPALQQACLEIPTMQLTLEDFHFFDHGRTRYTVWLEPEPQDALVRLHEAIWPITSECDHVRRFPGGFNPHLSIGQITGRERLEELLERLQANWRPLTFTAHEISLIWRENPPDDVFRVDRGIRLGDHHPKQTIVP